LRNIVRVVGQPSFVQSYERTSIYPKMTAYIEKWNVDIGDRVRKGDVLADLFVPELREQWQTTKSNVGYRAEQVRAAGVKVAVCSADVRAARARLEEAQAILAKFEAEVKRWTVQVDRLAREVERQVVAPQILLESQNELDAGIAARHAAKAAITKAEADLQSAKATLDLAKVNVGVARANLAVAESEEKRVMAMVGYLKLLAPFDGIIVARNANTWDFVLPSTGDPTAEQRSPDLSPGEKAAPIYVVDRMDIVRIFVDIPERDADSVHIGSKAKVKLWAYRDAWLPASVTRISWALNVQSRTMRAEIDLPNTDSKILPGMYAYGQVAVDRPGVRAVPESVTTRAGGKSFIWRFENGRAVRTEVQTGITDGEWIELTNRRVASGSGGMEDWVPVDGSEEILSGQKLSILTDGAPVTVTGSVPPSEDEPAMRASDSTPPPPAGGPTRKPVAGQGPLGMSQAPGGPPPRGRFGLASRGPRRPGSSNGPDRLEVWGDNR
jgi:multidrug efflux pump subunit AcrA (membrane-fusion protein)